MKGRRRVGVPLAAAFAFALALACVVAFGRDSPAATMPYAEADPPLWRWLPHDEDLFEPWRRHLAAEIPMKDERFSLPRGRIVVYDPLHHMVLYYLGCCAWEETVLAAVQSSPPHAVPHGDLSAVRNPRGIALGVTPAVVRRAYGPARLHPSTTTPGRSVLSYYHDRRIAGSACGWFDNFVFRRGRLTEIQAGWGC